MRGPNYPSEQPKNAVEDALVDRNSDPEAVAAPAPLKNEGDALKDGSGSRQGHSPERPGPSDERR